MNGFGDGHFDVVAEGEFADASGGGDALGDAVHGAENFLEFSAFADLFADGAVAAFGADAGGNEITEAGEALEGGFLRAHGHAEAGDFDEAASDEGGFGVVAGGKTVENSGSDGDDVFGCASEFGANHI